MLPSCICELAKDDKKIPDDPRSMWPSVRCDGRSEVEPVTGEMTNCIAKGWSLHSNSGYQSIDWSRLLLLDFVKLFAAIETTRFRQHTLNAVEFTAPYLISSINSRQSPGNPDYCCVSAHGSRSPPKVLLSAKRHYWTSRWVSEIGIFGWRERMLKLRK